MRLLIALALSLAVCLPAFSQSRGVDWEACASDLDDLQSEAEDAKRSAREAAELQEKFERCRRFPELDLYSDRCQTHFDRYRRASENASGAAQNALNAANDLQSSCSPMAAQQRLESTMARLCQSYKKYSLTNRQAAMELCTKSQGPAFCTACLGQ